jgi:hypothetical protein
VEGIDDILGIAITATTIWILTHTLLGKANGDYRVLVRHSIRRLIYVHTYVSNAQGPYVRT